VDFGSNQFRREGPPTRPGGTWWSRRSDTTRLAIVGGAVALVVWFVSPYLKGAIARNGHQPGHHTSGDAPQMFDPFGLLRGGEDDDDASRRRRGPRGEGDYAEGPRRDPLYRGGDYAEPLGRRLRLPPAANYGAGYGGAGNADGFARDRQGRPYRWRECTGSRQHPHCGPWHDGPAPGEE
jgi:hypothetical protein